MNKPFFWYLVTKPINKRFLATITNNQFAESGLALYDNAIAKIEPELLKIMQEKKKIPLAVYFTHEENLEKKYPACFKTKILSASLAQKNLKKTELALFSVNVDIYGKTEARDLLTQLNGYFIFRGRFPQSQAALEFESPIGITSNYLKAFINLGIHNFILKLNNENIRFAAAWCSDMEEKKYNEEKINKDLLSVWRAQIDALDQIIIEVLKHRMQIAQEMGKIKQQNNQAFFDAERWHEILSSRKKIAKDAGLDEKLVEEIFEAIHLNNLKKMLEEED